MEMMMVKEIYMAYQINQIIYKTLEQMLYGLHHSMTHHQLMKVMIFQIIKMFQRNMEQWIQLNKLYKALKKEILEYYQIQYLIIVQINMNGLKRLQKEILNIKNILYGKKHQKEKNILIIGKVYLEVLYGQNLNKIVMNFIFICLLKNNQI